MAFHFTISPGLSKPKTAVKRCNEEREEIPLLSLAPFSPNIKLGFENVVVGTSATQKLLLMNPSARDLEVSIKNIPLPEHCVKISWQQQTIPANGNVLLEISWVPTHEEAWRHTLTFVDGHHVKKNVAVTFKSILAKKTKYSKSKQGKFTVVSKKIKSPPKRMSPKSSSHKYQALLLKKNMSPQQMKSSSTTKSSMLENGMVALRNKENLDPSVKGNLVPQITYNDGELFQSPRGATFNIEPINDQIRRETFTVKSGKNQFTNGSSNCYSKNMSNDSLEEMQPDLQSTFSKSPNIVNNGNLSNNTQLPEAMHVQNTPKFMNDIKLKLDSSSFIFTPTTPIRTIDNFTPLHSTSQKSNTATKQLFVASECTYDLEPKPTGNMMAEDNHMANISTETYVKGNISTETYLKGNISSETYTLKGNLSSSTYVKDNSVGNLVSMGISPNSTKKIASTSRNVSPLLGETTSNIDGVLSLSPILKDSSMVRLANMSGENARSIIEANLWCEEKRILHFIDEESVEENPPKKSSFRLSQRLKRKSTTIFDVSPPKKIILDSTKHMPDHRQPLKWNKSKTVPNKHNHRRSIEYLDPFLAARLYHDQQWIEEQEIRFKKWLNALLTPPAELDSNTDGHPLDVAKLWQQCKHKAIPAAPSKEAVSSKYHTNKRLDTLRKTATNLFMSREVSEVLNKALKTVESGKLSIRSDKDIHLDLGLQSEVMTLFLSYNPLWLRIGLETIYGITIPLSSNSDIMGLSSFIMQRFFRDPFLLKKHKSVHSPKYVVDIKKFILKKFLIFVYFLDVAKSKVLIAHDPCLFCKNAPIKENREILLRFSRELLSAVGDVTKFLRFTGYTVRHTQKYIHEFDYSVIHLGVDLRDGVRLTKVMEIILIRTGLTDGLRIPAISRLQKIHNMKIVFDALQKANFEIVGDISFKDIVDGHQEKTLSFLWQIIYKFQAPLLIKASITIQTWWRSLYIVVKRRILFKKQHLREQAALKIQCWYKRQKLAQKLERLIPLVNEHLQQKLQIKSAIKIQSYIKMYMQKRKYTEVRKSILTLQRYIRTYLIKKKIQRKIEAVIKIQACVRMWIVRTRYLRVQAAVIHIQQIYRAKRLMIMQREKYKKFKDKTIFIQRKFRANREMKIVNDRYTMIKAAVLIIQKYFRATIKMRNEQENYLKLKKATLILQTRFRALTQMKTERTNFQHLKRSVVIIQQRFRATILMKAEYVKFQELKRATIIVQRRFRANSAMKLEQFKFKNLRKAAVVLQNQFRANEAMKIEHARFQQLKKAVTVVQTRYRANVAMKIERAKFQELKKAVIFLQRRFSANRAMVSERSKFLQLKKVTLSLQRRFRANKALKIEESKFLELKKAVIAVQRQFRANRMMEIQHIKFLNLKTAALIFQRRFRANRAMKIEHTKFQALKKATVVLQMQFKAHKAMVLERTKFLNLKKAAIILQRRFRANKSMKLKRIQFQELKNAATIIQRQFRANMSMKIEHIQFQELKTTAVIVQRRFRANRAMKNDYTEFQKLKIAVILVQRQFRANQKMLSERTKYLDLKKATVSCQRRFRGNKMMKIDYVKFQELRKATIVLQRRYKANKMMMCERSKFLELKKFAIIIQRRFRANKAMHLYRTKFQNLKKSVIVLQSYFRATKEMKIQHEKYQELKRAAHIVQRRFRANRAMKIECTKLQEMKKATVIFQRRFRAHRAMVSERTAFLNLKKAVMIIQKKFRSNRVIKTERDKFKAAVVLQRRFRAKQAMQLERMKYEKLKKATRVIQEQFRAHLMMKIEQTKFQELKKSTLIIQRRLRATRAMKIEYSAFQNLKKNVIFVQRHFRANKKMVFERAKFINLKIATIKLQRRFRGNSLMKTEYYNFQELKVAAVIIQRRFKANRVMMSERTKFLNLKRFVIIIQRRFRANKAMKFENIKYQNLKNAAIAIQRRLRAKILMKMEQTKYQELKRAAVIIQSQFKANKAMMNEHVKFQELKKAAVVIQRRFRANKAMKLEKTKFQNLQKVAIILQRRFRANQMMKIEHGKFQALKRAVIILQKQFRTNKSMRTDFTEFQSMKNVTLILQRRFRANRAMKTEHAKFQDMKKAAIILQRRFRINKAVNDERARFLNYRCSRNNAATKIQACWRGYQTRKEHPEIADIRENAKQSTLKAIPYNTLGHRRERAVQMLYSGNPSLLQIIRALEDLEFITRRCKDTCLRMSRVLPEQLYITISSTNRSPAEMQACTVATSILINFCKYRLTASAAWLPQHIDNLIKVMSHCCDKEDKLFSYLCTLMWLFAHNEPHKQITLSIPNCASRILKIKALCLRKEKMVSLKHYKTVSYFSPYYHLPLPTLFPDWGLDYPDRPRTFVNSLHGLSSLLKILDLE